MTLDLEVLANGNVVFEGVVYSNKSVQLSDLICQEAKRNGHPRPWNAADGVKDKYLNSDRILLIPRGMETEEHNLRILNTKQLKERLMIMKSAITDEKIPSVAFREWIEESDPYPCGQTYINEYREDFGRDVILGIVKDYHFTPALPEVRKVILEGLCPYLKTKAIETITSLGGRLAAETLASKLDDDSEFITIRDAAAIGLRKFSYASSVPALVRTFEKTAHISPWDLYGPEKELLGGGEKGDFDGWDYEVGLKVRNDTWLPMLCLSALSSIPTIEAVATLEKAASSHLKVTSEHARYCITKWIDTNLTLLNQEFISTGRLSDMSLERTKKLKKLVFDYDLTSRKNVYNTPFGMMTIRKKEPNQFARGDYPIF